MTAAYSVREHAGPAGFLDRARTFLLAREAEHTLILGLTAGMVERGEHPRDALFATVEADGAVVGCAFRTPPHKLVLTDLPHASVPALLSACADRYDQLPAVLAPAAPGQAFAERWAELRGVRYAPGMRQGIHELTRLIEPARPAPGRLRRAGTDDLALVSGWIDAFGREAHHPVDDPGRLARERIDRGTFWIWEDQGIPVCLAGRMGRTPHGDRIGYVYTPPAHRGRGYASVLVARLSEQVLAEGLRFCSLYTDLANPTSNAVYQRLGYRLIAEVMDHTFGG